MFWKLLIMTVVAVSARNIDRDAPFNHDHQAGEARNFEDHRRPNIGGPHHQSYIQSNGNINPQYEDFDEAKGQVRVEPRHIHTHAYRNQPFDSFKSTDDLDKDKHRDYDEDPKTLINENSKLISDLNLRIYKQSNGEYGPKRIETYVQPELGMNRQNLDSISRDGYVNQNNRQQGTKQYNTHVDQHNYNKNAQDNSRSVDEAQIVNKKPHGTQYDRDSQRNGNGYINTNPTGEHHHHYPDNNQNNANTNDSATKQGFRYETVERESDSRKTDRNADRKYGKEQAAGESDQVNETIKHQETANNGTLVVTTETANGTVVVEVPNRAAFTGDKCPTGQIKVNDMCVDKD